MTIKIFKVDEYGNRSKSYKVIDRIEKVKQVSEKLIQVTAEDGTPYIFNLEKHSIEVYADLH